jgi:4-amino-4-deoxy-L-arabinose transferase-like glycosyltransferase
MIAAARWRLALALLLGSFAALSVAYSLANPLYEATDELRHVRFVRHIAFYHGLPQQQLEGPRAQSHHPPLYYALGALASFWAPVQQEVYYEPPTNPFWAYRYWEVGGDNKNQYLHGDDELFPFRGIALSVYSMRWYSVLLGAATLWLTYYLGREVWPGSPALAFGGAALVAFNPQFLYLSGAVGNDVASGLAGAAVLLACVRLAARGITVRRAAGLGILFGLAMLVKSHLAALLVLVELALLVAAVRERDWRAFLRANGIALLLAAAVAGWWFVRNQMLYGEPTGFERVTELWGVRDPRESFGLAFSELPYVWTSLWGRFGYGQVPMPDWAYRLVAVAAGLSGGGLVVRLVRTRGRRWSQSSVLWLAAMCALFAAVVFAYMLVSPAGPMGRFFFPALPAFGLLLFWGLASWVPERSQSLLAAVVTLGMAVFALWAFVGVLRPAFARPRELSGSEAEEIPNPASIQLGDVARLRGYQVAPAAVLPGQEVDVTLYWETLRSVHQDYVVFIHLLDDDGVVVAQRDTYPGLGSFPTSVWEAGTLFADTYRVHLPETAYTPNSAWVQVGMYLPGGPRLSTADGRDAIRLSSVEIDQRPDSTFPNQVWVNIDNQAALLGYTMDRRFVRPGDTIHVTLYWEPLRKLDRNYSVFVQVLDPPDRVAGKGGSWPANGNAPTKMWRPGEVVEDAQRVTVDVGAEPGIYELVVGLVGPAGRLPVVAEDGHWLARGVTLSRVRVQGPDE